MSPTTTPSLTVDIRGLGNCTDRKAHVLATFDDLAKGDRLVVVNDHMPNGLLRHFEEHRPGADPAADDAATLALDLLMAEEGYGRAGTNLYLVVGG